MSTYYNIHTEVRADGVWHCVDPLILHLKTDRREQQYELVPTCENGSRSYFGQAADKLESLADRFCFDDLSEELKAYFMKWQLPPEKIPNAVSGCAYNIPVDKIRAVVQSVKGKTRHGLAHKDSVIAFESGEADDVYNLIDPEDYSKLDEEAKKVYQYYEWDDPMEWVYQFRRLMKCIDWNLAAFEDINFSKKITDARIILTIT